MIKNEVSVIIPCFNSAKTIISAINSVLTQTVNVKEVIVVNDHSTDNLVEIVKTLSSSNSTIRLVDSDVTGAGPVRNFGVSLAQGEVIAFLDADDVWDSGKLEAQLPLTGEKIIVGCYARYFLSNSDRIVGTSVRTKSDQLATEGLYRSEFLPALTSSWVMRRKDFLELGGFNPEYILAQDFEFAQRAIRSGYEFKVSRRILLSYCLNPIGESSSNYLQQFATWKYLSRKSSVDLQSFLASPPLIVKIKGQSGLFFRRSLFYFDKKNYLNFLFCLLLSSFLDPVRFITKIKKQGIIRE